MATRAEVIAESLAKAGTGANLVDMTLTPLSAPGWGDWVPCLGRIGFIHATLSDSVNPVATFHVYGSNVRDYDNAVPIWSPGEVSGAKAGAGTTLYDGPLWICFRLEAIAGVDAAAGATVAWAPR